VRPQGEPAARAGDNVGMAAGDAFDLERFVAAQDAGGTYERAVAELRRGAKTSHWMWFVFPQLAGLGTSATARHYALAGLAEARAYLAHPLLGARLRECTRIVNAIEGRTIEAIFGYPDYLKFHSCMTLFARAAAEEQVFRAALEQYYGGEPDARTVALLSESACGTSG